MPAVTSLFRSGRFRPSPLFTAKQWWPQPASLTKHIQTATRPTHAHHHLQLLYGHGADLKQSLGGDGREVRDSLKVAHRGRLWLQWALLSATATEYGSPE